MSQNIEHSGKVLSVNGNMAQALITQHSACAACHAKAMCTATDKAEKIIEANFDDENLKVGDDVFIIGQQSLGLLAVFLAFVLPFLLILLTLFILRYFMDNEAVTGIMALATLIPYFLILSLFNKKLKRKFQFYIRVKNKDSKSETLNIEY
ncbi:MAG: SoxR reducing system RseC family protein [Paludibacter sp.]|jgi:sigma-E factor negative regulatory protein RseC|nr:SoxR reducing system RseC family protein [Paludibacter sp.]